jgi:hypothetical protein
MNKITFNALLCAIIAILSTCNYEFPAPPYPRVETLEVTDISNTGATYHAQIIEPGPEPIINHGFVWYEGGALLDNDKIELGAKSGGKDFDVRVGNSLAPGKTYYVKAFAITEKHTVYGLFMTFKSQGSLAPKITSFTPAEGSATDTVTLTGENFSTGLRNNLVNFGTHHARVTGATQNMIKCLVPKDITEESVTIFLEVAGHKTQSTTQFRVTP